MHIRERIKWRPKLRTVLLIVNLTVLILPVGGIYFFRFYENELVRQTESELIAQGVIISELYKKELGGQLSDVDEYGVMPTYSMPKSDEYYRPIPALLDLASGEILPPREDPVSATTQPFVGAVDAGLELNIMLSDISRTTLASIRVTDYHGIVVASSRGEVGLSYAHIDEVKTALAGRYNSTMHQRVSDSPYPALESLSRGTGIRVFVNFPIVINDRVVGAVLLSRSPRSILKALHDRKNEAIVMGLGLLGMVILLTLFTSYTINRPIHSLIDKARRLTKGEKNVDLKVDKRITQEVSILSDSIAVMADTIEKRSDYIRDFARSVSHEFKTPLTSIGGTVELLQEHIDDMSEAKRERFLNIIQQDTSRLDALVGRLLELAKADVSEPVTGEATRLGDVLPPLQSRYREFGLTITCEEELQNQEVNMLPENVATIFCNLFDNSRQHGASEVTLKTRLLDGFVVMDVIDNGQGVLSSNQLKIFDSFFTTNRDDGGTGLGLGIVKSLLNNHGGDISVNAYESGAHFTLKFAV